MKTLALLVSVALVAFGCASEETSHQEIATETPPAPAPADPAVQSPSPTAQIEVAGALGCGHCTFEAASECVAAIQTEDGIVHILEGVDPESSLFTERYDEKQVQVMGTPREEDGAHYLAVTTDEPASEEMASEEM